MPKSKNPKLAINLDLLKPESNPEKLFTRIIRWLLSSGRYIFIFVEAVVLIAFISRFKLDADLASNKEKIEEQIPYIENQKSLENLIKQTQLKLSTIGSFKSNYSDYPQILQKISDQMPASIRINSITLQKNVTKVIIEMNAIAGNNVDLSSFVAGLKQDHTFSDISVTTVNFEKGTLNFSLNAQANITSEGKSL